MTGKRYSAGAIFLQVVPVFGNIQKAIESEAENIDRALGDRMEKAGEKAGERAGKAASKAMAKEGEDGAKAYAGHFETQIKNVVKSANREIGRLDLSTASEKMLKDLDEAKAKLKALSDQDFNVDFDSKKVIADVAALQTAVEAITKGKHEINVDANFRKVLRDIAAAQKTIDTAFADREVKVEIEVDTKPAEREMTAFEKKFKKITAKAAGHLSGEVSKEAKKVRAELEYMGNLRIGVDIGSARAQAELKEIAADIARLSAQDIDIDTNIALSQALAELKEFSAAVDAVDGKNVKVKVNSNADAASNSFRSFNIILLATASAGPALIPILAGIAGGLLALGPAAAVASFGLGAVLVGFSGLGDAVGALQAQQDQAATGAQASAARQVSAANAIRSAQEALSDARRNAARAAEDAAERVSDARRSAADAIEDALERQRDAQEAYRDSVKDVQDAEQALREARANAAGTGEDLGRQIQGNALAQDQAMLDQFNTTVNFNAVSADGSATNAEQEQARIDMEEARLAMEELRAEGKELAAEKRKWDKEGVNGTDEVKSAEEALADALDAQRDAYEGVRDSAQAVDEARRDGARAVSDAIEDQSETLSDNARAISRAEQALSDARKSAVDDMKQMDAQAMAVKNAFDKLGPAGAKFALFLFSLKSGFYEFRDAVQQAMLPAVQEAIEGFIGSENAGKAKDMMVALAGAFGQFTKALSVSFQGPAWGAFFEMMAETGPKIFKAYGGGFISMFEGLASMMVTAAPFALRFAKGFERLMDSFAAWAASKEGADQLRDFIGYVERVGPMVVEFFGNLVGALVAAGVALAPYGELVLTAANNFLKFIEGMDPEVLGAILSTLTVFLMASQVVYAIQNMAKAGQALFATALGPWIFLIIAVGVALAYLYQTNEDFAKFIDKAWGAIAKVFKDAWENDIKPALMDLWESLKILWKEVLMPFLKWLEPILMWVIKNVLPRFLDGFGTTIRAISWFIREIAVPAFKWLGGFIKDTWKNVIKPVWDYITDTALPAFQEAFQDTVNAIGNIWETLQKLVGTPIKFIIEEILNDGLIAGYNRIAGWVGADELNDVKVPSGLKSFATGGIMPGYTPGRDPHKFVSPTGGRLELSGGEAIMRPEFTRAVGSGFVDSMNAAARIGGIDGVRRAMGYANGGVLQSFAKGGIMFPVPGGYVNRSAYNLGHDGMDINHPWDASGNVPFFSATSGRVTSTGYSRGYGNAVFVSSPYGELVYGHSTDASIKVAPGQPVSAGQWLANIGNTGNSEGHHLHFGFPGGTFGAVESLLAGALPATGKISDGGGIKIPGWLLRTIKDPLGAFKGWITDPIKDAASSFADTPFFNTISKVPALLGKKVVDKVWDIVPGWVKSSAGWAGDAADWAVGGVKHVGNEFVQGAQDIGSGVQAGAGAVADFLGFANGGILPYNGTMMYDSGGYLPPGMTTVMNLTGKPEPVFTNDQWSEIGAGGQGGTIHYEPHFEGSDLTAADVAGDLNFTFRKIRRGGKYAGVGQ